MALLLSRIETCKSPLQINRLPLVMFAKLVYYTGTLFGRTMNLRLIHVQYFVTYKNRREQEPDRHT